MTAAIRTDLILGLPHVHRFDRSSGQNSTGPTGAQAQVAYNTDGTPTTSSSTGATVTTKYGYDNTPLVTHDLKTITFPTGTGMGVRTYGFDALGRLSTATNGNGDTLTYTYDNADRITREHSTTGTTDTTYAYDAQNRVTQRVDASGTTAYTYATSANC
jgi:YD repeat-containing protein